MLPCSILSCIFCLFNSINKIFSILYPVAAGKNILRCGCGTLAQQTISQIILHNKSNRQADLDPAPLSTVFMPKVSSQTDIGVEIVQS